MLQNALAFLPVKITPLCFLWLRDDEISLVLFFFFFFLRWAKFWFGTGRKESEVTSKLLFENTQIN